MPTKTTKKKAHRVTKQSDANHSNSAAVEPNVAVYGVYPRSSADKARPQCSEECRISACGYFGLVGAVFPRVSRARLPLPEVVEIRKTAGVLLTVNCDTKDMAKRATAALESTGAEDVAFTSPEYLDLNKREYRDEDGNIHHHTHEYLREHSQA